MKVITESMLAGACGDQLAIFRKEWPDGAPVTLKAAMRAVELKLDLVWVAGRLLSDSLLAEYERQRAQLWAEYERQRAQLWAEYERQRAPLWAEYQRQEAPLWAEYQRQEAPLWAEYQRQRALLLVSLLKRVRERP